MQIQETYNTKRRGPERDGDNVEMSYLRWLCAMQYAKIVRQGNAFVETVHAFRLHRQQKTLACEAAAKARAEFWSRLSESFRELRTGQPNFLRKPLPSRSPRQISHTADGNVHKTGAATVHGAGSFRRTAKQVVAFIFRGGQELSASPKVASSSPLLGSSLRHTRESISKLLQLQKQRLKSSKQQIQPQRQLSAENYSKLCVAKPHKPLSMLIMSRSNPSASSDLQQNKQKADQKDASTTNKATEDPTMSMLSSTRPKSEYKTSTQNFISNVRQCETAHGSSEQQKAMLLPERPDILVLSEVKNNDMTLNKPSACMNELFRELCKDVIQNKESQKSLKQLPTTTKTLISGSSCKISTAPAHCILPSQTVSPVTLLVTNVLDKYKIISLPAGRAIPGQPKRQFQIEVKRNQNQTELCDQAALKRSKV